MGGFMRLKSLLVCVLFFTWSGLAFATTSPVITLGNSVTTTAGKISIPVILNTNGATISLLAISISYDPAKLSKPVGTIGDAAGGLGKGIYDNVCSGIQQTVNNQIENLGCTVIGEVNTPGTYKALIAAGAPLLNATPPNPDSVKALFINGVVATITFDGNANSVITLNGSATDAAGTTDATNPNGTLPANNADNILITLKPGWNLISLPVQQNQTAAAAILSTLSYSSLWRFFGNTWQFFDPANPDFSDFADLTAGTGYWIYMSNEVKFQARGIANRVLPLAAGWNLVGYAATNPIDIIAATNQLGAKLDTIWGFTNGVWGFFDPVNPDFSDFITLEPGKGYWVKMKESATWTLP